MSEYGNLLDSELERFQLQLPPGQRELLVRYCDELERWNRKINLTGLSGRELVCRLVVEPVWVAMQLELSGTLLDIGSGNGSPAIPIHIVRRLERADLVEIRTKRAAFLRHVTGLLKLPRQNVHRGDFNEVVETLDPPDWITLQAVTLSPQVIDSIKKIARPTTTIVWITAAGRCLLSPIRRLEIPQTGTEVLLFRLDLS